MSKLIICNFYGKPLSYLSQEPIECPPNIGNLKDFNIWTGLFSKETEVYNNGEPSAELTYNMKVMEHIWKNVNASANQFCECPNCKQEKNHAQNWYYNDYYYNISKPAV